jgi:phosphoglycolate phosphatase/pyrophosphatase PpaX
MKYKCLVLDHDDTIVNSTATVNYPSFMNTLKVLRPEISITLEDFFRYNFEPGFGSLCSEILHFSDKEMYYQTQNWLKYVMVHTPPIFEGIDKILWRFYNEGGHICVVSHSMNENILRDYRENDLPMPDMVFGWDMPPEQRKPSVWAIEQIIERLSLKPADLVMIDDLKPGKIMADNAGINFIGAGWAHSIPEIVSYMKAECKHYCSSVKELENYIF